MEIKQLEFELGGRKHPSLDPAQGADEIRLGARLDSTDRAGNRQPGIQMSAGAATGEENAHPYARSNTNDGSVARPPITFSRVLPTFTRMPVISIESTRLDLP